MKRFLLHVILILAPIALVLIGWEFLMRSSPHDLRFKRFGVMEECRKSGEMLVLGSSHAFYGVKTDSIPAAYNLAFVSQPLAYDRFIFETFLKKPNQLKFVVIPVSAFSLFGERGETETWKEEAYVRYWGYPAKNFTDKFFIFGNLPQQLKQYKKTQKRVKRRGIPEAFRMSKTGWGTHQATFAQDEAFRKAAADAAARHCCVDLENIAAFEELEKLVSLARENKIKVILFTPPAHKFYYEKLEPRQMKKMYELLSRFEGMPDVFYLDLLKSPLFVDADFGDADHLNPAGAEKLAKHLHQFARSRK